MLHIRDYHPLWFYFPENSVHTLSTIARSYNPDGALPRRRFGLFPGRSPLLGESLLFSFPPGTKMFQFPGLAPMLKPRWPFFKRPGCPIRKSADQRLFAPTRGLSQLITSFIASVSLGIRHPPLITFLITHTFSCCRKIKKQKICSKIISLELSLLYSLACVNMSKIERRER